MKIFKKEKEKEDNNHTHTQYHTQSYIHNINNNNNHIHIISHTTHLFLFIMDSIIAAYESSSDDEEEKKEESSSVDIATQKMKENVTKAINYDSNEACLRLSLAPINPDAQAYVKH